MLLDRQEKLYERQSELEALLEACKASDSSAGGSIPVTVENWSGEFEWDARADDIRFNVFGISSYRANQREVSAPFAKCPYFVVSCHCVSHWVRIFWGYMS